MENPSFIHKSEQALLNEYKGNLFEYLVASSLSQKLNLEEKFVLNLSDDFRAMFSVQERFIRSRFPHLIVELPKLADQMAEEISNKIDGNYTNVSLVGKSNNSFTLGSDSSSADIVLEGSQLLPISLKLSKKGAFVNTRSAGIKSFFSKYFPYGDSALYQNELNLLLEDEFNRTMMNLHESYLIEYDEKLENWTQSKLPTLPGQLSAKNRTHLHELYNILSSHMISFMEKLYREDEDKFLESIFNLMGYGNKNLVQAICFYKNENGHYQASSFYCEKGITKGRLHKENSFVFERPTTSSFEFKISDKLLQIRIKPMNKFTSMAFKINCSVKYPN